MTWARYTVGSGVLFALGLGLAGPGCGVGTTSAGADAGEGPDGGGGGGGTGGGNACDAGQSFCAGACTDTSIDDGNCGACGNACTGARHCAGGSCQESKIQHVVLIVQENHSFDAYFGLYCQAPTGSSPSCTTGRGCCEAAPSTEPGSTHAAYGTLDDNSNFASDRNHDRGCELLQIDDGAMDQYVTGPGYPCNNSTLCCAGYPSCSDPKNWVMATGAASGDTVNYYWALADGNALADRFFQPMAGGTAGNDMYFAGARFQFADNEKMPDVLVGVQPTSPYGLCVDQTLNCVTTDHNKPPFTGDIGTLLIEAGKTFTVYADGYAEALAAATSGQCASRTGTSECPYSDCIVHPEACNGCLYDPSDIPFLYFATFADSPADGGAVVPTPYASDYASFATDIASGNLPNLAFVKARVFHNEHPNFSTITDGEVFVQGAIQAIESSPYASSTLILVTWDEGGGFFDHVPPPAAQPTSVDRDDSGHPVPYGTRVPFLAIGPFVKKGSVSHVQMEHSSVVRFLEYNFLGAVGQLHARDAAVNNLGSLLDPGATGIVIPSN